MAMPTLGPRRASNLSTGSGSHYGHPAPSNAPTSAKSSPVPSPAIHPIQAGATSHTHLPLPMTATGMSASTASGDLQRQASTSSQRSALSRNNSRGRGMIPSPRLSAVALSRSENGSATASTSASAASSTSGSRNSSFIAAHTPRLLTRRSSEKAATYGSGVMAGLLRSGSGRKGKEKAREMADDELATASSATFLASDSQEMYVWSILP
jgi:hypothetical protein